jgi:hypothetical protein
VKWNYTNEKLDLFLVRIGFVRVAFVLPISIAIFVLLMMKRCRNEWKLVYNVIENSSDVLNYHDESNSESIQSLISLLKISFFLIVGLFIWLKKPLINK